MLRICLACFVISRYQGVIKKSLFDFDTNLLKENICFLTNWIYSYFSGYDGVPIESLQGLDLNSDTTITTYHPDNTFVHTHSPKLPKDLPEPPMDINNQVAAWYDTDL